MHHPVIHVRLIRASTLTSGTTIMWYGPYQQIHWGQYLGTEPVDEESWPRMLTIKIAPGCAAWPKKVQILLGATVTQVVNPDTLPPVSTVQVSRC